MAEFKIDGRMKVKTLKEKFKEEFGGILHVYKNAKELADDDSTLAAIRTEDAPKVGDLVCRGSRTVGGFEKEMLEYFGIKINVFTADNWVAVLDGITLNTIKDLPKQARKADMEKFVGYQRKTNEENGSSDNKVSIDFKFSKYPIMDFVFEKIDWELTEEAIEEKREEIDMPGVVYVRATNEDGDFETNVFTGDIADCLYDALEIVDEKSEDYPSVDVYYTSKCEIYGSEEEDIPFKSFGHVISSFLGSDDYFSYNFETPAICKYKDPCEENMWLTDDFGDFEEGCQIEHCVVELLIEHHSDSEEAQKKIEWIYPTMECINEKGEVVFKCVCDEVMSFKNDTAFIQFEGKWGLIDKNGKQLTPYKYDDFTTCDNGMRRVEIDGKYGFIDEHGVEVVPCKLDEAGKFSKNGLARVAIDDKYGFIDEKGEIVIPCQFDSADDFLENGLACFAIDNKYGFINEKGEIVIPCQFDEAYNFNANGLAKVRIAGKYGFVNEKGEIVIPCKFDRVDGFSEGLAWVK